VFTLAVGNSDQYGNDAIIAPRASVTDGALDLTAIGPVSVWNAVPLLARMFTGTLADGRNARLWRGTKFVVQREAAGPLHTDGEVHAAGRVVEFVVRPASLRVLCPAEGTR
jgi:diacylglycerol kinase family enzyme